MAVTETDTTPHSAGGDASPQSGPRYRCNTCGNLTRFDVVATRRTKSFHHYSVGGELTIDSSELLAEDVESVTCRWCSSDSGVVAVDEPAG